MSLVFKSFTDYLENLPARFDPNVPRTDNVPPDRPGEPLAYEVGRRFEDFMTKWTQTIQPHLFLTPALLQGAALQDAMKRLNDKLTEIKAEGFTPLRVAFVDGRRPDVGPIDAMWADVLRRRQEHFDLAR
jgi:hypothetical protein